MDTIVSRLHTNANNAPDAIVLETSKNHCSYLELSSMVVNIANSLESKGIAKGDRVLIQAKKNIETVALILATMQIQAVAVPYNQLLKPSQIAYLVKDCDPSVIFAQPTSLNQLLPALESNHSKKIIFVELKTVESNIDQHPNFPNRLTWDEFTRTITKSNQSQEYKTASDNLTAILYTSGSTGNPKGVMLSEKNLSYGADSVSIYLGNTENDRILALMPLSFDYGLSQITTAIHSGACAILYDYFLPKAVVNEVVQKQVTGLPAVPHVWDLLADLTWPELEHLRYITSTGGRFSEKTISKLNHKLPNTHIFSMYGFTESFRATYLQPSQIFNRSKSIGKAVPHSNVSIVRSDGNECDIGETGELVQTGPLVALGYWNDTKATEEKFKSRFENTQCSTPTAWSGDFAWQDSDGFIYFKSRKDDQIKINGYRINPAEVEDVVSAFESIIQSSVIAVSENARTVLVAFIVTTPSYRESLLNKYCAENLPQYMIPAKCITVSSLPANPNNKVDKHALIEEYERLQSALNSSHENLQSSTVSKHSS